MTNEIEVTSELLSELKNAAIEVTPGPWVAYRSDDQARIAPIKALISNAAFIALANPAVVLALIDEIERLRGGELFCRNCGGAGARRCDLVYCEVCQDKIKQFYKRFCDSQRDEA